MAGNRHGVLIFKSDSAQDIRPGIQMDMVGVQTVMVGGQHHIETFAGFAGDFPQESGWRTATIPVVLDSDDLAVTQFHPGKVNGTALGMFGQATALAVAKSGISRFGVAADQSAVISAQMIDMFNLAAEMLASQGLDDFRDQARQDFGSGAAHDGWSGDRHRAAGNPHRIFDGALPLAKTVEGFKGNMFLGQVSTADGAGIT